MRNAKSLVVLLAMAALNGALVYGCSSDADPAPATDEDSGTTTKPDTGTSIIVDDAGKGDAKGDAKADAKKDTGAKDTSVVDAPPDVVVKPKDPPFSPCDPQADIGYGKGIDRDTCGLCGDPGTQPPTGKSRVCLKTPDSGAPVPDGGTPFPNPNNLTGYWSDWGACTNGPGAVCDKNQQYPDEACGNCGTRNRICQLDCTWVQGITCNQPAGACKPGEIDWENLGCPTNQGRVKTCDSTCQFDIAATCTAPPPNPNKITVNSATVGGTFSGQFVYETKKLKKVDVLFSGLQACPTTLDTTETVYSFVEVKNTTASTVKLSIYLSAGATAPVASTDTIMAIYAGAQYPRTDAERLNCLNYTINGCDTSIPATDAGLPWNPKPCVSYAAGLIKGEELPGAGGNFPGTSIAPGQSVTVYVALYSSTGTAGSFKLNARVEN